MEFPVIPDFSNGQCRGQRSCGIKNFCIRRVIDVVETGASWECVDDFSIVRCVHAHDMISTSDKEKSTRTIQHQSLQITAAGIPCSDHFVGVYVDGHSLSRLLNICVKNPAL